MLVGGDRFRLDVLGPFGLFDQRGERIEIASRRGRALIAMLATGKEGTRSRSWLQEMLWGSRAAEQAQASLRRELSNLRQLINRGSDELLGATHDRVWLRLHDLEVDLHALEQASCRGGPFGMPAGDFLEGLDIPGEEGFEDWLRQQRRRVEDLAETAVPPVRTKQRVVDIARAGADAPPEVTSPSVAVLPFRGLSSDRQVPAPTERLADEFALLLSRFRWLPVIAPCAGSGLSIETAVPREIGAALAARYIVDGRLHDSSLRVTLYCADDGRMLWSGGAALPASCHAETSSPVLAGLVGAISVQIEEQEMRRAMTLPAEGLTVADLIWRARWQNSQYTSHGSDAAEALLDQALAIAPHSSEAIIQLAFCRQRDLWRSRADGEEKRALRRLAQQAIAADPRDARGYMIAGIADLWMRNSAAAIALLEFAVRLNPALAYAHGQLGAARYLSGQPEPALASLDEALRLDMGEEYAYYLNGEIAMARAMLGDWPGALAAADQSLMRRAGYWYAHIVKIYALVRSGEVEAAAEAREVLDTAKPSFRTEFIDWLPFVDRRWPQRLKQAFALAVPAEPVPKRTMTG